MTTLFLQEMSLHRNPGKMSELTSHRADYTLKQVDKVVPAGDYSSLTCVPGPFDSESLFLAYAICLFIHDFFVWTKTEDS